jgi:hypothetical protein
MRAVSFSLAFVLAASVAAGCSTDSDSTPTDTGAADAGDGSGDAAVGDTGADGDAEPDAGPVPGSVCDELGLLPVPFDSAGPYGVLRHELADDFTLPLADGSTFTLSEAWTGCDAYLFMPDSIVASQIDNTPLWQTDLAELIERSPRNAHYFLLTRQAAAPAEVTVQNMQAEVDRVLGTLSDADAEHWRGRLHVVQTRVADLDGWLRDMLISSVGSGGFGIDPHQHLRGFGSLSDVTRYDAALAGAAGWGWANNLAYVAHEALWWNQQVRLQQDLDADGATVVSLWQGEVIEQFDDMEVELPSAEEMAGFDTLEFEIEMRCPNTESVEFGNCGAWDYLAHLWLFTGEDERLEMSRFITTYHREARWVIDATPMLYYLREGGTQKLRWEWAPEWNVQPTATWVNLRFSNQGRGVRPIEVTPLFQGGSFTSTYNDGRERLQVDIPAAAEKVELWAVITGHGADTNQCAEFCNHQHEFIINNRSFYREHPQVGNQEGCIEQIDAGMTPNQWGTWWFGRGGWCPGQQVDPMVEDVTEIVEPGGTADVDYFGWYGGRNPPDNSGNVLVESYLVTYGAM